MQPKSQRNPNIHRGPRSSREFNELMNDVHQDVTALFDLANTHDKQIRENMNVLIRENFFLQNKLSKMEAIVEQVKATRSFRANGLEKQQMIKSFYGLDDLHVVDGMTSIGYVDPMYGVATLMDSDRVSKTTYKSGSDVVIPRSFEATLYESNNVRRTNESTGTKDYYIVDAPDLKKAFDRSKDTFWVRTASFPKESNITEVYGILHLKLPLDIVNNLEANTLTLNPYPEFSMTIRDIHYKGYGSQWYRLPNYPVVKDAENVDVPAEIKEARKLLFTFPNTEMTEIQIHFTQPYWFQNETNRDFVYGFQDIELENRVYHTQIGELVTEFSLENTQKAFDVIDVPVVVPATGGAQSIDHLVEHKLYYNKDLSNEFSFGTEIMAPINKVYVKTTLKSEGGIIPVIKQLKLNYTYKENTFSI